MHEDLFLLSMWWKQSFECLLPSHLLKYKRALLGTNTITSPRLERWNCHKLSLLRRNSRSHRLRELGQPGTKSPSSRVFWVCTRKYFLRVRERAQAHRHSKHPVLQESRRGRTRESLLYYCCRRYAWFIGYQCSGGLYFLLRTAFVAKVLIGDGRGDDNVGGFDCRASTFFLR